MADGSNEEAVYRYLAPAGFRAAAGLGASRWLFVLSLWLGLSVLYQIYFYDWDNGVLSGGGTQRLLLKVLFTALFSLAVRKLLSSNALLVNLLLKLPLLFVCGSVAVVSPYLTGSYLEALNIFFFFPILWIDWNRPGAAQLYRTTWRVVAAAVFVQLLLDPVFKAYFGVGWSNGAFIGGMGNPNVFGLFLIVSGLATQILLKSWTQYLASIFFLATILTGSLVSFVVGFACALVCISVYMGRSALKGFLVAGLLLAPVVYLALQTDIISDSTPMQHAVGKFLSLAEFQADHADSGPASLSARREYLAEGLNMLVDSPVAILVGHPNFTAMYNGDGLWTSFLVTYGLPVTLLFLIVNLVVAIRGFRSRSPDLFFSAAVILVMLLFFVSNRILDYWPAPLIYLLTFSYLTNKGVRGASPRPRPPQNSTIAPGCPREDAVAVSESPS